MNSRLLARIHAALVEFYAPGLDADTYVARCFALTSRLLRSDLNAHGVIDRATGRLEASFDSRLSGLADAFGAFGHLMNKYPVTRFDPRMNDGRPFSIRDFYGQSVHA